MELVPIAKPITAAATANTNHPMTATPRCSELHRPARAARFHRFCACGSAGPRPGCPAAFVIVWPMSPPLTSGRPCPHHVQVSWIDRKDPRDPVLRPSRGLVHEYSCHAPFRLSWGLEMPTRKEGIACDPTHPAKRSSRCRGSQLSL